jgi:cellulose synthase/poly-beta-1,6-N-acetylglucosamine synthase-like glycosyltransferase
LKAFLGGRIGWSSLNSLLIVSGAFGLFRKDYLIQVGGYRGGFPGEDMNVIIKLHKYMHEHKLPYRILFCPDAVCWTQAPDRLDILGNQRKRWSRGTVKNMWQFRSMLFIPKYKTVGFLAMPYTFFFEMLHPYLRFTGFLAVLGYCLMDMTSYTVLLLFMLANMLISIFFSCGALWIEEISFRRYPKVKDLLKLMAYSVLMTFGYDQLNLWWKFMGHIDYIRNKNTWGVMVRKSWKEDVGVTRQAIQNQTI